MQPKIRRIPSETIRKEMGARIREMRKEVGATIDGVAKDLHISSHYLSSVERGIRGLSQENLVAFSDYFHCTTDFLLTGVEKFPKIEPLGHSQVCKMIDALLHEPAQQKLMEFIRTMVDQQLRD